MKTNVFKFLNAWAIASKLETYTTRPDKTFIWIKEVNFIFT